MYLLNFLRRIKHRFNDSQNHLLRIEINSQNLLYNISQFRKNFPEHRIAAVLKSNAYGHGLKEVGLFLDRNDDIRYLAVDSWLEAHLLREFGVKKEIIILGYVGRSMLKVLKKLKPLVLIVNSLDQAKILKNEVDFPLMVHLKIDTGMRRQGIFLSDLEKTIKVLSENKHICVNGLMTHLADANIVASQPTFEQLKVWSEGVKIFRKYFPAGTLHFTATAGTRYLSYAESNLIRIGIGLYGYENREDKILNLKPILSFWAKIVNIKEVKKGEGAGYNFTFKAEKDMKIAILPCGYYEGLDRALSNVGVVYYKNQPLRLIGRMSMNLAIVDISEVKEPLQIEDEIEVISSDPQKLNSAENYAKICGTTPYEIFVRLAPTIKRFIV